MIKIIVLFFTIQFYYSQDKGLTSFEKEDYKQSYDYYLNILKTRKNDISAKFGAGISAFKNQDIQIGMKYLQEVSNSEDDILASMAHFNLANIFKDENKLEESIYHYKKAIELNSKDREAKINYELLKEMLAQEGQESQSNQDDEGDESQESQESQKNEASEANNDGSSTKKLSDKEIQAEAILNALKDQEKINQKQKLLKFKSKTLEKDW